MTVSILRVLCTNCGGDEVLSRLAAGATACPWCGLSFDDGCAPSGGLEPVLLPVVLTKEEPEGTFPRSKEASR